MQMANRFNNKDKKLLAQLNDYISPVDSGWITRLKPADAEMISKLELYLGVTKENIKLPISFIEFSEFAGECDGGLLSTVLKGEFSIEKLVHKNEKIYKYEQGYLDPYNFEFLVDEMGMGYFLQQGKSNGIYYEDTCFVSSSFENLLFQCAVRNYEERYFAEKMYFGSSIRSFKESVERRLGNTLITIMQDIVKENCLECAWFNDPFFFFGYNDEISIFLVKQISVAGKIMGNDKIKMNGILEKLLPRIGAEIQFS